MDQEQTTSRQRTRQACEPYRGKKTKCTGERPVCSFCQRLNLPCTYLPRSHSRKEGALGLVAKRRSNKDRIRRLESQINDLSELLHSSTHRANATGDEAIAGPRLRDLELEGRVDQNACFAARGPIAPVATAMTTPSTFSEINFVPPAEALHHFVDEYSKKVHLQPLPLFNPSDLQNRLKPQFLLHSFLALMLNFSTHCFYLGKEADAIKFYGRSAAETIMHLASDGVARLEVIQSLCLLTLGNIAAGDISRAWMSIGTAARLEYIRRPQQDISANAHQSEELSIRCFWSVYMLETIFFPHMPNAPELDETRKHAPSAEPPRPIQHDSNEENAPDLDNADGITDDLGINTHCARMIGVWGKVSSHLHKTRLGEVETPWLPDSTYSRLNLLLYDYEAQLHHRHLLRNLFPSKRPSEDIRDQYEYWHPWLTTHMILHASLALINHPFIHLVALRRKKGVCQSRLFLQHIVDRALFHTGWVFWLVQMFKDLDFEIHNPLLGVVVAATATIPWLYQFAKDQRVSRKATEDLKECEGFLQRLSLTWPHISQKIESLRRMRVLLEGRQQDVISRSSTITFPPSMLWELLDPSIHEALLSNGSLPSSPQVLPETSIHVTTNFLHPWNNNQLERRAMDYSTLHGSDIFTFSQEDLQGFNMDNGLFYSDFGNYVH